MTLRRFGPLMVAVVVALAVSTARLFQVQVLEHDTWAREAANLSRESEVLPYLRGEIRDRDGVVLAQDESVYRLELAYRDFRREHPLGQVAHGIAELRGHALALGDVAAAAEEGAELLVGLTPRELEDFAAGAALPTLGVAATDDPRGERRRSRAASARFYVWKLLAIDRYDWSRVKRAVRGGDGDRSWFELAQAHRSRGAEGLDALRARVAGSVSDLRGLAESLDLTQLADNLDVPEEDRGRGTGLPALLELLQRRRDAIEDAVASELFGAAAGFPVGVLPPEELRAWFALDWIAELQGWDEARLDAWLVGPHRRWLSNRRSFHAPAAAIQADLEHASGGVGASMSRFLDEAARVFEPGDLSRRERMRRLREGEPPWWRLERCAVLDELVGVLDAPWPEESAVPGMPFQDEAWRAAAAAGDVDGLDAAAAFAVAPNADDDAWMPIDERDDEWRAPATPEEWRARFERAFGGAADEPRSGEARRDRDLLPLAFQEGWLLLFQSLVRERLHEAGANAEALDGAPPFDLRPDRLERAADRRDYAVRDRGSRIVVVHGEPPANVVQKLSRFPERFAGFRVRDVPRRKSLILWDDDHPLAEFQVGGVRHSTLTESVGQAELLRELRALQRRKERNAALRETIALIATEVFRADEQRGRSGAELLYDEELRGTNGYREREGLAERRGDPDKEFSRPPVHGEDLELSLDVDLQRAAQEVISHPALPPDQGLDRDDAWFASPVGAIVMIRPDGEVLAAASAPREPTDPLPGRSGQRQWAIDRTLRRPTGQPPGSIFKPLIAAHALETRGLDPFATFACVDEDGTGAGYGGVHCHRRWGHGDVDLHESLKESCNSYFAQVGELYEDREAFLELAHFYGLDQPTGINLGGRPGYYEDWSIPGLHDHSLRLRERLTGGNGLSPIEATPLQMARAFAGLATGELPELRMVRAVGGRPVPEASRRLQLSRDTLDRIRRALVDVCEEGSAARAELSASELGFPLAAKTGSADFLPMNERVLATLELQDPSDPPSMRKHTWVAGWFPADAPRAVFVVYLHDVGVTSGKNAIFVAEQFLHREEIRAYLEESAP